jgi:hypothetical protein
MLRHRAVSLILTLGLLWRPGAAMAQQIDSLAALKELALALLAVGSSADHVLRIGQPGVSLPPEALEPGARVIGSLDQPWFGRTVLVVAGTPDEARSRLESRLLAEGWKRPVFQARHGGFTPEPFESSQLCKEHTSLRPVISARLGNESLVVLYYGTNRQDECGAGPQVSYQRQDRNPMPSLYPPLGIRMQLTGMGGFENQFVSSASLDTRRAVEDVLSHFASQLRAAGWQEGEKAKTGSFLTQQWQYADSTGTNWSGLFVVSAPPSVVRRDLLFTVSKAQ